MSRTYRNPTPWDFDKKKETRDKKKWGKPNKTFKVLKKQKRKAKEKQALKNNKEIIPEFKKTDQYDWL